MKNTTLFMHHYRRPDRLRQWGYRPRELLASHQDPGEGHAVGGCGGRAWWEGVWDHIGGIEDRTIVPSVFIFQLGRFEKVYLSYFT